MAHNVKQYRALPEAKPEYFVDMEEKKHQVFKTLLNF